MFYIYTRLYILNITYEITFNSLPCRWQFNFIYTLQKYFNFYSKTYINKFHNSIFWKINFKLRNFCIYRSKQQNWLLKYIFYKLYLGANPETWIPYIALPMWFTDSVSLKTDKKLLLIEKKLQNAFVWLELRAFTTVR